MNDASDRYDVLADLATARLALDWYPLVGVNSRYHRAERLIVLRDGLRGPEMRLALATALAQHELDRTGRNPSSETDAARIAVSRLVPLDALGDRLAVHNGGITAVAADLGVPTTAIRARLQTLDHADATKLARRIRAARREHGLPDCDPLRRLYTTPR